MSRSLEVRRVVKLRRLVKAKAKAGKAYSRVHALTVELLKLTPAGTEVHDADTRKVYTVRDNFAGRVAFKMCKIDRHELVEVTSEKPRR